MALSDEIYEMAAIFAQADAAHEHALRVLCGAAETQLRARLRKGVQVEDCYDNFVCAAAWMAVSALPVGTGGNVESFSVGDISVKNETKNAAAECLRTQAEVLMAPFCQSGFSFLGVRA